jgi:peptide/nickel transport system substrate-binding protein
MKTERYFIMVSLVLALVIMGWAQPVPAQTRSPEQPLYGGMFTLLHNGGIAVISSPSEGGALMMLRNTCPVFERLLKTDDNERLQPWLAESWDISRDGKMITLHLRRGIKFHDGTDFNAEAVKYNLETVKAAAVPGSGVLSKVSSYDILDPYTIRLNLTRYDATLLLRLAQTYIGYMVSPTAHKIKTTPENAAKDHMVGTGPFKFDSWQRDTYVRFKKFDGYWQKGKPYLDGIQLRYVADLTVSLMAFMAGEAQAIENIDPIEAKELAKKYDIRTPNNLFFFHNFLLDGGNPDSPFANKKVREAVEYAIDKKIVAQGVGMGYYPLIQFAAPTDPWYVPGLKPREYDPAKAKQLLAEAGYPNGFKTKLVADPRARRDPMIAAQTYLKEVGIDAELDMADIARATVMRREGWKGIFYPGFPNAGTFIGIQDRYGQANDFVSFYRPPGWQEKWNALLEQPDEDKRLVQFKELIKMMYDEVVAIPYLYNSPLMALNLKLVHGFKLHANHTADYYEPENIWLSK